MSNERIGVNKKTVSRIMREEKLTRPKFWHRPARPKRVRKMRPTAAVRTALDSRGLTTKKACQKLTLRSDNGSQPCSKAFVEYLGKTGVQGEYTGYNAPDDNAYAANTTLPAV